MKAGTVSSDSCHEDREYVIVLQNRKEAAAIMAALLYYCAEFSNDFDDTKMKDTYTGDLVSQLIDLGFEPIKRSDYPQAYNDWWNEVRKTKGTP